MRKPGAVRPKTSLWGLGGLPLPQLLRELVQGFLDDELFTRAAALSFYFIFALFPMILSLVAVLGLFAQSQQVHAGLVRQFSQLMPSSAAALLEKTIQEISTHSSGWKLAFGLLAAWWSGSSGVSSIMDALNRSYRVRESRAYWKRTAISLGLTATMSALSMTALAIFLYGSDFAEFIGSRTGLSQTTVRLWQFAQGPIALVFVLFALALIYNSGPDIRRSWRWITPGSLVAVLTWVAASLVFRVYVHFLSSYSRSYGSLGAVMVLLLWLYITGLAILLGGEIDAVIDRAAGGQGQAG